jgi:trans-aconitate methyltransferase
MSLQGTGTSVETTKKTWNPGVYDEEHSFVWKAAQGVVELLAPKPGERILDLGCGTGHLTQQIAAAGADVVGVDLSPAMLEEARRNHPDLRFEPGDATSFHFEEAFDAVFSNAVLHWVTDPVAAATRIFAALRPGGRFVAELGGRGNLHVVHGALQAAIREAGHTPREESSLLYFPSLGEYARVLEGAGFRVTDARHFDRPTPLTGGDLGFRKWVGMFADRFLAVVPEAERDRVLADAQERARPRLYEDGRWSADYVRLRIGAVKP